MDDWQELESLQLRLRKLLEGYVKKISALDDGLCEDIVANVFAALAERKSIEWKSDEEAIPYLFRACRNGALSKIRKRQRQAQSGLVTDDGEYLVEMFAVDDRDAGTLKIDEEKMDRRLEAFESALRDFALMCERESSLLRKAVYEKIRIQGADGTAAAQRLGITPQQVYQETHRANEWLKGRLRRYDPNATLFRSWVSSSYVNLPSQPQLSPFPDSLELSNAFDEHPDRVMLEAFVDGLLAQDGIGAVEEHLASCPDCAQVVGVIREGDRRDRRKLEFVARMTAAMCPTPTRLRRLLQPSELTDEERMEFLVHIIDGDCAACKAIAERGFGLSEDAL
ncbi:MAG: zf-HC2 domain-containing protein [Planctomycetota bacterium]|jgi:DNA-directed RNA polymerase specialized sigma24 family protein